LSHSEHRLPTHIPASPILKVLSDDTFASDRLFTTAIDVEDGLYNKDASVSVKSNGKIVTSGF